MSHNFGNFPGNLKCLSSFNEDFEYRILNELFQKVFVHELALTIGLTIYN